MIRFLQFRTPGNTSICEEVLKTLCDTFGPEEEKLERRQLLGIESEYNEDYLFVAFEDGKLLGNIHLTINLSNHAFGCLGGLVTLPEARGRGIATKLFGEACDFFDSLGGELLLLGTSNMLAARIYEKFGFKFISGTAIMARVKDGSYFDFCKSIYSEKEYTIEEMDDGCRVPIIPLIAERGRDLLMDYNAKILNNKYATQNSCSGLYPRFLDIKKSGRVFVAKLKNQGVCAVLTERILDGVSNIDCFAYSGFENVLPELLTKVLEKGKVYSAILSKKDEEKIGLFKNFGFVVKKECGFEFNNLYLSCNVLELTR